MQRCLVCLAIFALVAALAATPSVQALTTGYESYTLDNGLKVVLRNTSYQDIATVGLAVKVGQEAEVAPDSYGLNYWTTEMMYYGTNRRPNYTAISAPIERNGGFFSIAPGTSTTVVWAKVTQANFRAALDTVADVARNPLFNPDQTSYLMDYYTKQLAGESPSDRTIAYRAMLESLFGSHPYGHPQRGNAQAIRTFNWAAFKRHHEAYYVPNNCVLFISGAFEKELARQYTEELFSDWKKAVSPLAAKTPEVPMKEAEVVNKAKGTQANVYLGYRAPGIASEDGPALAVLAAIWGDGLGSRIFQELRSKHGLAYACFSEYDWFSFTEPSLLYAYLGTSPDKIAAVKDGLLGQAVRFKSEEVTDDELARGKALVVNKLHRALQENNTQVIYMAFFEVCGLGYDGLDALTARIRAVSKVDILRVATRYMNAPVISVVKP